MNPLTKKDCDLRGMPFMPLDVVRLIDSDLFAISTGDEFKAAVALWCKSWLQVPAASLPTDDRVLAHLSGTGSKWKKVKDMALRGWVLCDDGRLYHPVIAEKAIEASDRRKEHEEHKNNDLNRKKQEREDRKAMFELLRSHGIVKPFDTTTSQLRALVSQLPSQPVTDLSHGQVQDCHAQVTAKTGTGTGTGTGNILNTLSNESSSLENVQPENDPISEKPITAVALAKTHNVDPQVAKDFLANRKAKKLPLTKTALDGLIREFELAGLSVAEGIRIATENGWAGFKKVWLDNAQAVRGGQSSKVPDNNTTAWLTPELAAEIGL